jgi:hypothetical protein
MKTYRPMCVYVTIYDNMQFLLEQEKIQIKVVEKIETHVLC